MAALLRFWTVRGALSFFHPAWASRCISASALEVTLAQNLESLDELCASEKIREHPNLWKENQQSLSRLRSFIKDFIKSVEDDTPMPAQQHQLSYVVPTSSNSVGLQRVVLPMRSTGEYALGHCPGSDGGTEAGDVDGRGGGGVPMPATKEQKFLSKVEQHAQYIKDVNEGRLPMPQQAAGSKGSVTKTKLSATPGVPGPPEADRQPKRTGEDTERDVEEALARFLPASGGLGPSGCTDAKSEEQEQLEAIQLFHRHMKVLAFLPWAPHGHKQRKELEMVANAIILDGLEGQGADVRGDVSRIWAGQRDFPAADATTEEAVLSQMVVETMLSYTQALERQLGRPGSQSFQGDLWQCMNEALAASGVDQDTSDPDKA